MLTGHSLSYATGGRILVADADVEIGGGQLVAIVGPNGAGKTTLLRLLAGELRPTAGEILIDGLNIARLSVNDLARRRAVVSQSTALSFPFTVRQVVLLGATVPGFQDTRGPSEDAVWRAMEAVGLSGFEDRLYTQLSGGERQRVHVARALCQLAAAARHYAESQTLLLDEPTASLDLQHQALVLGEMRRQAELGRGVVVILHDLNLAAAYADEMILMGEGRIVASGMAREVLRDELLSRTYGCSVRTNEVPKDGRPFVLPAGPRSAVAAPQRLAAVAGVPAGVRNMCARRGDGI